MLIIQDIKLVGLSQIKESVARSQIRTRKGEVFDPIEAKSDVKRLMNLGIFFSADVETSTISVADAHYLEVRFLLAEKQKIRKVFIKGNKKLSRGSIMDILAPSKTKDSANEFQDTAIKGVKSSELRVEIDKGAFFDENKLAVALKGIQEKYEEKAIFNTVISTTVTLDVATKKLEVTLDIKEGRKGKIAKITLEGFANLPIKKVRKFIKTKEGKTFKLKSIQKGAALLQESYKEDGWIDYSMSISSSVMQDQEVSSLARQVAKKIDVAKHLPIALTYTASEGRRHFLLAYRFAGYESLDETKLRKLAGLKTDKVLKNSELMEAQANILNEYRNRGYLFAEIDIEKIWKTQPYGVELVFNIKERHKVYIGSVYVEGLLKTKEHCIKREILLKEGDLFSAKRLMKSQEKIFNLGFIEDVRADYDPTQDPSVVDLIFDVKEGRPGMLTAGAGFSSLDGMVGTVSLQHLNMLGRAQRVNLSTEFGKRRQSYDLRWTSPWTFDKRMSTTFGLFNTNRSLQYASSVTAFKKRSKGGSVFFAPRYEEDTWILGVGYSLQQDRIYDVLPEFRTDIPESTINRSAITTSVSYDTRDFRWDPKRGTEQTLRTEFVGGPAGGNVHFIKPTLTHTYHIPTVSFGNYTFVLSNALRWGF
ncbi:MAG: POTRA domain-containing protein, partial [Elusimicrobiota bacterium]